MAKRKITGEVEIPEGITAEIGELNTLKIKGEKGELTKQFYQPKLKMKLKDNKITFEYEKGNNSNQKIVNTYVSLIKNMIKGVTEGITYKLKICSGHFPMNVSHKGNEFSITNFLGEKNPRKIKIKEGVEIKVNGAEIEVTSIDKELAGQTAADIESLTKVKGRDIRIFQDGIYMTEKDGKPISKQ